MERLLAPAADTSMFTDRRPSALLALAVLPTMFTDRGSSALFILAAPPTVFTDRGPSTLLVIFCTFRKRERVAESTIYVLIFGMSLVRRYKALNLSSAESR